MKRVGAPRHVAITRVQRCTGVISAQSVWCVPLGYQNAAMLGGGDLQEMFLNLVQDESVTLSETGHPLSGTKIGDLTRRLILSHMISEVTIRNMTNAPVTITLYNICARRDRSVDTDEPDIFWYNGLQNEAVTGLTAPTPGQILVSGANTRAGHYFNLADTPFQSEDFVMNWRVEKVTKFALHPGSEHVHTISMNLNRVFSQILANEYGILHGLTQFLMMSSEGAVTNDTATPALIGTSTYALDIVTQTRFQFQGLERMRTVYISKNEVSTIIGANEGNVEEDTDHITTVSYT